MASWPLLQRHQRNWYEIHPCAAALVAAALFAVISVAAWFNDATGQAVVILYVLPIALLAVSWGLRGGAVGASVGFGLFAVLTTLHSSGAIGADGWVVRGVVMFLLGILLGHAADQNWTSERAALLEQERRCRVEDANRRYAEAMEISDSLVQQMAAAKWLAEDGQGTEAAEVLACTIEAGETMARGLLERRVGETVVPFSAGKPDAAP